MPADRRLDKRRKHRSARRGKRCTAGLRPPSARAPADCRDGYWRHLNLACYRTLNASTGPAGLTHGSTISWGSRQHSPDRPTSYHRALWAGRADVDRAPATAPASGV